MKFVLCPGYSKPTNRGEFGFFNINVVLEKILEEKESLFLKWSRVLNIKYVECCSFGPENGDFVMWYVVIMTMGKAKRFLPMLIVAFVLEKYTK